MHQIWTNPSLQRNVFLANESSSELVKCLKITKANKSILLMPNFEYSFTYIDPMTGANISIRALAVEFFHDCIKVKCIPNEHKCSCCCKNERVVDKTVGCSCVFNPPDISKYNNPATLFIPIANLINVEYIKSEKYRGEVRVMLLGISAEVVKAIIIRMAIFDDNVENAVKNVTLEAGKVYDFTYVCGNNIHNNKAKVVRIEEVEGCICSRPNSDYVREHIGAHNSVYVNFNDANKEEFMQARPAKKVKIIVDISADGSGIYETIMLDCIRDCILIKDDDIDDDPSSDGCDCGCAHDKITASIEDNQLVIG